MQSDPGAQSLLPDLSDLIVGNVLVLTYSSIKPNLIMMLGTLLVIKLTRPSVGTWYNSTIVNCPFYNVD